MKIRDQVTLLKTESLVSTIKARPWMLVAPAKSFRTCKTTILEISLDGKRLKKIKETCVDIITNQIGHHLELIFTFGKNYLHIIKVILIERRL